jgi:Fe2+ transport system protein B
MAVSSRGVVGGAKRMRQRPRWKEIRAERIARQKEERAERQAAAAEAAEEEEEEERAERQAAAAEAAEEEEEEERPARSAKRRGKKTLRRATFKRPSFALPAMNANRWTAAIIWLVGAFLTRSFLVQIGVPEQMASPIGILLQWLLTKAESPLWQGSSRPPIAIIATIIDAGMNAGGTWVYTKNIGATDFWAMIQYAAEDPTLIPSPATQIAIAVAVGLLTAAAAEYYWNLE